MTYAETRGRRFAHGAASCNCAARRKGCLFAKAPHEVGAHRIQDRILTQERSRGRWKRRNVFLNMCYLNIDTGKQRMVSRRLTQ
jgi:hypothetical protein